MIEHFPEQFIPTAQQRDILHKIQQAFDEGYKYIVINAPTGSGKSFISKTLSNNSNPINKRFIDLVNTYAAFKMEAGEYVNAQECINAPRGGAFALTITKALQDQYAELFDDTKVLKGKSNYTCNLDKQFSVDCAPCLTAKQLLKGCYAENMCSYYRARNEVLVNKFSALNYSMFFSLPEHVRARNVIVCDEASELEDQLVKQFSCLIDLKLLNKYGISIGAMPEQYNKIKIWLVGIANKLKDLVDEKTKDITQLKSKSVKVITDKRIELNIINQFYKNVCDLVDRWESSEYISDVVNGGIMFVPLRVDKLSEEIFKYTDKVILLSATIIDPANFCKTLGITNFKYIEVDSTFPPDNAPIYINKNLKLNYKNLQANLPTIANQIKAICKEHANDKGIIHTHTNTITEFLSRSLVGTRFLFRDKNMNNEAILQQHYASELPTVLISPSMSYGIDLKDDLARFQIIIKAPFLPLADKRIKKMAELDFGWYMNRMLCSLIQSCGRGIRNKQDHCVTYILDGTVADKVLESKSKLPKYFLNRFA